MMRNGFVPDMRDWNDITITNYDSRLTLIGCHRLQIVHSWGNMMCRTRIYKPILRRRDYLGRLVVWARERVGEWLIVGSRSSLDVSRV